MNYLAFDIGGTNTKYALVTDKGEITKKSEVKTPSEYQELIQLISSVYESENVQSSFIGLSCPGIYDPKAHQITGSSALDYLIDKDIISDVKMLLPEVEVVIENDGNCALLGEFWLGNASGVENAAMIVVGSAVGGGTIVNGKLLRGSNLNAGEFGYMMIDNNVDDMTFRSLGGKGGLNGLINNVVNARYDVSDGRDLFGKVNSDEGLKKFVEKQLFYTAVGIINLQYILDPAVVIIGGAISRNEQYIEMVKNAVDEIMARRPFYKVRPKIAAAKFGNDANLLGIVYKYLNGSA